MAWTACVVRIHRKGKVESFLVDADKFVIGRSPECDFVVADEQISRQHLGILLRNGQAFLKDLGSANGSFIGDQRVPQDRVFSYKQDDVIRLGNTKITVTLEILGKKIEPKLGEALNITIDDSVKFSELIETVKAKARALNQDYERIIVDAREQLAIDAQAKITETQRLAEEIIAKATADASKHGSSIVETAKHTAETEARNILSSAQAEAQQLVSQTQSRADVDIASAKHILADAERKSQELILESQVRAKIALDDAQKILQQAEAQKAALHIEAQEFLDDAKAQLSSVDEKSKAMIASAEGIAKEIELESQAKAKIIQDEATKLLEQAEEKKKHLLSDIETSAARANVEAQLIIEAGKKQADELIAASEMSAKTKVSLAETEVSSLIESAKKQAETLLASAQQAVADSEKKGRDILAETELRIRVNQETADKIIADIVPQKMSLMADARAEAERLKSEAMVAVQKLHADAAIGTQEAQLKADASIQAAVQKSQEIILESKARAQSIVEAGEQSALRIVDEAKKANEKLAHEAQQQALEIINVGRAKADLATKEANSYLDLKRKEAEASAQKILQEVNTQVDRMHSDFEAKKRDEFTRLEKDFEQSKSKLKLEQENALARFESDFQLKHKLFDEECSIRRRQVEKELQSETEKVADNRKLAAQIQIDIQSAQDKLSQTSALGQAAESHLLGVEKKITLATKSVEDLSVKVDGLSREEQRLQAFVNEINQKKKDFQGDIQALQRKFEDEKSRIDKETYDLRLKAQVEINDLRQKENQDIQRVRMEELEKIDGLRKQAVEDIVRNKSVFKIRLSQKIEGRVVSVLKSNGLATNLPELQKEILELVQGSIEEQTYELAQGHEADIKQLVTAETTKRKVAVRRTSWVIAASIAAVISLFIYNGGNISNILLGLNQNGETGAEEFGRIKREERAGQKFDPPQSDFIKSNYTDNVLYTRAYTDVYNDPQLQEKWIHELNKIFSKEWNLDDDAIVKFVAIESTLIGRLKTEKESIIPGFEKTGIDKMRKVEKESLEEMKSVLKDSNKMRKFQSFAEKFWYDSLKERKPANAE